MLATSTSQARRTVVVSTSGDTGPSAIAANVAAPNLDCIVLYPEGRVSRVQEAQMLEHAASLWCAVKGRMMTWTSYVLLFFLTSLFEMSTA